jgi:hypothetical protein
MPSKSLSLASHLSRLRNMAFHHFDRCHKAVKELHSLRSKIDRHPRKEEIYRVYSWLLCPLTLWAVDYVGLANHMIEALRAKREFDDDLVILLQLIESPPGEFTQGEIMEYEKIVRKGHYDSLSKQPDKFRENEVRVRGDQALADTWAKVKKRLRPKACEKPRWVLRRTMSQERNFNPHRRFSWKVKKERFQIIFDAICYRWGLYGFENDSPLLLKISVNPTPHGTMIVIPRHWSFDRSRDLDWAAISKIHRAHGVSRQGPKLSSSRIERQAEAAKAKLLCHEAKAKGLRGEDKFDFVLKQMGKDPRTDVSWLKRLLKL